MVKFEHTYYVYILTNKKHGILYVGMTNDITRRMYEHKYGLIEGFTKRYQLNKLVYGEFYKYVFDAITREKRLKNWKREWKIALIEKENVDWIDLAEDWF